jgi:DNA-binding transcriptional MerR regulator
MTDRTTERMTEGMPGADPALPGQAPAARRGSGTGAFLSIGEVLTQLRSEFPDVTISKIRFLESEGLVEPERASSGYRKFSRADVDRLRFVLSAQRDRYLPLKVIRDQLAALDRNGLPVSPAALAGGPIGNGSTDPDGAAVGEVASGAEVAPTAGQDTAEVISRILDEPMSDVRLSRSELCSAAGITDDQLSQLEQYGLIAVGRAYDGDALVVARTVAQLARYGIEARHLRPLRAAADREVGLVEQVVAPLSRARDPQTLSRASATAREIAALSLRLHASLVKAALRSSGLR